MMHKFLVFYKFEQYNVIVSLFSQHVITPSRQPVRRANMAHNDHRINSQNVKKFRLRSGSLPWQLSF